MKRIYNFLFMLGFVLASSGLGAQISCVENLSFGLSPFGGDLILDPSDFVLNSEDYDSIELSQESINCDDIPSINIEVIATVNGVSENCLVSIMVIDNVQPVAVAIQVLKLSLTQTGQATLFPELIDGGSYDHCSDVTLSIEPSTFDCSDIGSNIVTLTVEDASGNYSSTFSEVIVEDKTSFPLACHGTTTYVIDNGIGKTYYPGDFLVGYEGCIEALELVIEDANGEVVADNFVNPSHQGMTFTATVTSPGSGNSCWGILIVEGGPCDSEFVICDTACHSTPVGDCASGHTLEDNVEWPCDVNIFVLGIESYSLNPNALMDNYGVSAMDAEPTLTNIDPCWLVSIAYDDNIFYENEYGFKIVRTWTIIEWNSTDTWTYTQTINNLPDTQLICDTLSRSTPVADCASGHTLEDDVEWPDDITIEDHRITPNELVAYSSIDPLDASPSFYNEPDEYSATYTDLVEELGTEMLIIRREWLVVRTGASNIAWTYAQFIEVNFSEFQNLIAVNTFAARPVPNVQLTEEIFTSIEGKSNVPENENVLPWLSDGPKNGVDLLDIIAIRKHVLGIESLSDKQILAGDISDDGIVSTLDIVLIEKIILGKDVTTSAQWEFFNITNETTGTKPRAHYLGVKPGDVNDSAVFGSSTIGDRELTISYDDKLLNEGETYTIPFYLSADKMARGLELSMLTDNSAIEVTNIASDFFNGELNWAQHANGELNILMADKESDELAELATNDVLFEITILAKSNSVLGWSLDVHEEKASYLVDESYAKIFIDGEIEGAIISGTDDKELLEGVSVYPNPVNGVFNVDIDGVNMNDVLVQIFDNTGRLVRTSRAASQIDVHDLPGGIYMYQIQAEDKIASGKLLFIH